MSLLFNVNFRRGIYKSLTEFQNAYRHRLAYGSAVSVIHDFCSDVGAADIAADADSFSEVGAADIAVDADDADNGAEANSSCSEVAAVGTTVSVGETGETAVGSLAVEASAAGIGAVGSPLPSLLDLQAPTVQMENASSPPRLHELLPELFATTRPEVPTSSFNPLVFYLEQNDQINNLKRRRDELVSTQSKAKKLSSVILIFVCCHYYFLSVIRDHSRLNLCCDDNSSPASAKSSKK